jgi:hypothetical protein
MTNDDLTAEQTHPDPDRRNTAWRLTASLMVIASMRAERNRTTFDHEWSQIFEEHRLFDDVHHGNDELTENALNALDDLADLADLRERDEPHVPTTVERQRAAAFREHMLRSIDEWCRANL